MAIRIRKEHHARNFVAAEVDYWNSKPVLRTQRILKVCNEKAGAYVLRLRQMVLLEGNFDGSFQATADDMAFYVKYPGPPDRLLEAFKQAELIRTRPRSKRPDHWEYIDWRDTPTGRYQLLKEYDRVRAAAQRAARKVQDAQRQQAAAEGKTPRKPREKAPKPEAAGPPEKGKKVLGRSADVHGFPDKERKAKQSKISPYPQTGAAPDAAGGGGDGSALWAWFFQTHPKPDWPAKSRARWDSLTDDDHALIKLHLEKVVLKKPDAALGMLAYLHSCQWLQMRRKPMTKAKVATPPPPKEDQPTEAGLAEMKRSAELTAELKKQGLRGFELMQKVDEILAAERGDAPPTTTKAN